MSQQPLGLRRSVQIVRRYKFLVAAVTVLGVLIGVAYSVLKPPLLASQALVVIPQKAPNIATEVVIASSQPVLANALRDIHPGMTLSTLRNQIETKSLTSSVISITAEASTAAQAVSAANAVANSFIGYVSGTHSPIGHVSARLLAPGSTTTGAGATEQDITDGVIGALAGLVVGIVLALAIARHDRSLRERDDIANSIGIPVLAAFGVDHPSDAAGWTRLLDEYEPGVVDAWRLRQALQQLGITDADVTAGTAADGGTAVTVLSLSSDPGALALGPQLAVFAASCGILTALVVGPQQDTNATAALRTACSVPTGSASRSRYLRTFVADGTSVVVPPGAGLVIVVVVADGKAPRVPDTIATPTAVLAVSAGRATAEQVARAATAAASSGREVIGFLVADPESSDQTSGRIPGSERPARRVPPTARQGRVASETRR
jgi:capsular polysaccharide biosynthesis protein